MTRLELSTRLPVPPEEAFDLSLDVNAHAESMAASGERAVAGVLQGRMALGDTVTWRARHLGVTWRMTSRISAYERPHRFVDEQVAGPFRRWRHEHLFDPDGAGGTLMRDVAEFQAPYGLLGRAASALVLDRYLRHLLEVRNAHLAAALARRG